MARPAKKVTDFKLPILILVIFVILLVASEVFYVVRNKTPQLMNFYITFSRSRAKKGDLEGTFLYLDKAAEARLYHTKNNYPKLIKDSEIAATFSLLEVGKKEEYLEYFNNNLEGLYPIEERLSKIYYDLGLIAYQNANINAATSLLKKAVNLNPELSHLHIELSNLYLSEGNKQEAERAIDFCLEFEYPKSHCQSYQESNLKSDKPEEVGFLEKELEEYYESLEETLSNTSSSL